MGRVLFVTGSRRLNDTPEARAWATDILHLAFDWWRPDLLVHGNCPELCPDGWSEEIAEQRGVASRAFCLDGALRLRGAVRPDLIGFSGGRWATSSEHFASLPPARRPLVRNEHMVNVVARNVGRDVQALLVGLGAPWSKKHGTEHTVGLARATKKIRVEYRKCPEEFGPSGASR